MQEMSLTENFSKLFSELEHYPENEQKQKIEEMNVFIDGMNYNEFKSIFTMEMFKKVEKMIVEKKLSTENTILLLNRVEYCKPIYQDLRIVFDLMLHESFEKMIAKEEKKRRKRRNEKLLVDLYSCYLMIHGFEIPKKFLTKCLHCILKIALNKEVNEETKKEVEMTLTALGSICHYQEMEQKIYLPEIKETIQYHQEHRNLTRLAYQSAWEFLINRHYKDKSLEDAIVNELHFVREAKRELEELSKCVNWKSEEEKEGKERKEAWIISRWIVTISTFFWYFTGKEEFVGLINCVVRMFRVADDNFEDVSNQCITSIRYVAMSKSMEDNDLLKSGAIDVVLKKSIRFDAINVVAKKCLDIIKVLCERLKHKCEKECSNRKRKETKRNIFDILEEEGFEDCIAGMIHCMLKEMNACIPLIKDLDEFRIYL